MRNNVGGVIRTFPSVKQTKGTPIIEFRFEMTATCREFIKFSGERDVLFNTASMLESESKIIRTIRMALLCRAEIIMRRKRWCFVNANASFNTNPKTILCCRVIQFC
jgi:hypothetical protein